jgi:DNA-binding transcriptional regulator YdaS (Cro superfamily)
MTPAELKPIVEAWGGPDKLAAILGVKPRIVYYWLAGKRNMSEPTAKLIRSLKPPKPRKDQRP